MNEKFARSRAVRAWINAAGIILFPRRYRPPSSPSSLPDGGAGWIPASADRSSLKETRRAPRVSNYEMCGRNPFPDSHNSRDIRCTPHRNRSRILQPSVSATRKRFFPDKFNLHRVNFGTDSALQVFSARRAQLTIICSQRRALAVFPWRSSELSETQIKKRFRRCARARAELSHPAHPTTRFC